MAHRWKIDVDAIVGIGTVYRTSKAVSAHVSGDHDEAKRQWTEAGINLAGDGLGMVTGGAGKMIMNKVGRKAVKTTVKAATNQQAYMLILGIYNCKINVYYNYRYISLPVLLFYTDISNCKEETDQEGNESLRKEIF